MTPRQLEALDFIRERISELGFAPTIREIAGRIDMTVSGAHRIVEALIAAGYLLRRPAAHRGLTLTGTYDLKGASTSALRAELARRGVTLEALSVREDPALGRAVSCAADTCGAAVKRGMLMCRRHWFALPRELQDGIKRAFARRDVDEYQRLVTQARDLIDGGRVFA